MQEKKGAQHSTRMENLELNQGSEETNKDSFLVGTQDPKSGLEKPKQIRPTTVTKDTENHLTAENQNGMMMGDDKLMTPRDESEKYDNMEKEGIRPSGNASSEQNNRKK